MGNQDRGIGKGRQKCVWPTGQRVGWGGEADWEKDCVGRSQRDQRGVRQGVQGVRGYRCWALGRTGLEVKGLAGREGLGALCGWCAKGVGGMVRGG